jgi:hypothetical protein
MGILNCWFSTPEKPARHVVKGSLLGMNGKYLALSKKCPGLLVHSYPMSYSKPPTEEERARHPDGIRVELTAIVVSGFNCKAYHIYRGSSLGEVLDAAYKELIEGRH